MTNYWKLLLTCLTFVTSVGSAWAEEAPASSAEEAPAEEEPKTEVSLVAEAGLIWLAGNTQSITANGQVAFGIQRDGNRFSLNFGGAYGRSLVSTDVVDADGTVIRTDTEWVDTAKRVFGDARYDRFLVPDLNSIYVSGGAAHDPLAGLRFRAQGNAGYSHLLVNTDMHRFAAEAGFNYTHELYVEEVVPGSQNFVGARLFVGYALNANDIFGFSQSAEALLGGTDNAEARFDGRLLAVTGVTATLSKVFSVKAGFTLSWDFVPPEGFKPIDTTTTLTLVATLL